MGGEESEVGWGEEGGKRAGIASIWAEAKLHGCMRFKCVCVCVICVCGVCVCVCLGFVCVCVCV